MNEPLLSLLPSVKRARWRDRTRADDRAADEEFRQSRDIALARDAHTCRFCGFSAPKGMDVHHRDDNHTNNDPENLVTADVICHAWNHIGLAAKDGGATLVWCPQISPAHFVWLNRGLLVGMRHGSVDYQARCRGLWRGLVSLRAPLMSAWGTASPVEIGNALARLPETDYDAREHVLRGVRLLVAERSPMVGQQVIDGWYHDVFAKAPKPWESAWDLAAKMIA